MKIQPQSPTRLCVEIENSHRQAWKVPQSIVPRLPSKQQFDHRQSGQTEHALDYEVVWNDPSSFAFTILRKATGDKLFDTSSFGLTMKDQYLELSTRLVGGSGERAASLFGLGENAGQLRRKVGTTTTLWARDSPCKPDVNLYGCHPFFMQVLPSGSAHGVLLLSSNGMDIVFSPEGDRLTYKVIGGAIELYVFTGPTPQQVIQQYTELVGRPCMIPYYAQGFHICRWGYDSLDKVKTIVSNFKKHSLPLEAMWIDIEQVFVARSVNLHVYMKDYKCFTFDQERFPTKQLAEYVDELHAQDQKIVMILDPGIKVQYEPGFYEPYDEGVAKNLFVKRRITKFEEAEDGTQHHEGDLVDFVGKVWPGKTTFPDWFHPDAQAYWTKHITQWLRQVPLDGIWIDMNEAASFHDGDCSHIEFSEDRPVQISDFALAEASDSDDEGDHLLQPQHADSSTKKKKDLPNVANSHIDLAHDSEAIQPKDAIALHEQEYEESHDPHRLERQRLDSSLPSSSTVEPETVLDQGPKPAVIYRNLSEPPYRINNNNEFADLEYRTISPDALHHGGVTEYDAHNLYGHMEGIATYNALRTLQPERKPFILSRSTFPGSGRFVCKWNGDNWSTEYDMKASIGGLLNFQFFGIPMVGADIGGFGDTATEELLIRWHQLGAFYPFMRNHNCLPNPSQEPYITKALEQVTRTYVDMRYRLLPYWYTLFYRSHQDGRMVCSPVWVLDPRDQDLLSNDEQFLVGESLLISPVLKLKQKAVQARFPAGRWYDMHSGELEVFVQSKEDAAASQVYRMEAPLESIPVHLRGGHILPRAGIETGTFIQTTSQVQQAPLEILVALDDTECARGEYYHDDDSFAPKDGTLVKFQARPGLLTMSSFAADKLVDPVWEGCRGEARAAETAEKDASELLVPQGRGDLRRTFVQSVVVWGVGMDRVVPGKVAKGGARSSCQVEPHQVRVSIVRAVGPLTETLQHRRELRAVPAEEVTVEWEQSKAQLAVRFTRGGGLRISGDEALEVDWTEALVA
ncbi:alpha-glucosidase maltase [Dissophora ornata]|nr:alpha-glucosidase maltase [Dissophora ornata]